MSTPVVTTASVARGLPQSNTEFLLSEEYVLKGLEPNIIEQYKKELSELDANQQIVLVGSYLRLHILLKHGFSVKKLFQCERRTLTSLFTLKEDFIHENTKRLLHKIVSENKYYMLDYFRVVVDLLNYGIKYENLTLGENFYRCISMYFCYDSGNQLNYHFDDLFKGKLINNDNIVKLYNDGLIYKIYLHKECVVKCLTLFSFEEVLDKLRKLN